ncbi:hypothetical protein M0R88_09815 [Halorussus gelatinilyticus]|uniref:DUF2238 domain-containing protein n=1 Tax=Halorussus gelatinilyticus TaxID=2937524 RepID=A0A8U0IFJ6_9EURY|nr:hypothetical protein [Halorussus gelatinilyticus]UPV98828.1 hypothetical protein M0R88_09815 [Halorussus gelatinilyticus]
MLDSLSGERADRLSWLFVGLLVVAIVESVASHDLVWAAFLGLTLAILVLPPLLTEDWGTVLPPSVTALAALPAATRAFDLPWLTDYAVYVGVAAVALAVVVELAVFTDAEMAPWFADATVVMATMAAIGVWAVLQFYSDRWLGTDLLPTTDAVMWEFVRATVAGVAAAVVFEVHFAYLDPTDRRASDLSGGERG